MHKLTWRKIVPFNAQLPIELLHYVLILPQLTEIQIIKMYNKCI